MKPLDDLRNFGYLIKDLSRLYACNFERYAQALNLSLGQCKVLGYLQRHEGISQIRLAELTDTSPMTLARLLARMEQDGLVERRADPEDGRAHCLYLRRPALPVLEEIWRVSDRVSGETLSGLSAAERRQLINLLKRVHANLDALLPGRASRAEPSQ